VVRMDEQTNPHFVPALGGMKDHTLKVIANGNNAEMSVKEATMGCVLMVAIMDEGPSHVGDPHVVGDSLVILEDCEQASDNANAEDWKLVTSKKKNKEKGDGAAKAPKGPKKVQSIPPIGSKVLRNALSKKAYSNPVS
jgi:hypothetical protein